MVCLSIRMCTRESSNTGNRRGTGDSGSCGTVDLTELNKGDRFTENKYLENLNSCSTRCSCSGAWWAEDMEACCTKEAARGADICWTAGSGTKDAVNATNNTDFFGTESLESVPAQSSFNSTEGFGTDWWEPCDLNEL